MPTPISKRIERLNKRKIDNRDEGEHYEQNASRDAVKHYICESSKPVSEASTKKTISECNRIKKHVGKAMDDHDIEYEFDLQGSITNNTHIGAFSDIDLLVIPFEENKSIPLLAKIHGICNKILVAEYPEADIEDSKKHIEISKGSLERKIDVVPAVRIETKKFHETGNKIFRGIRILNIENNKLIDSFPFFYNRLLNIRDKKLNGDLKPLIRLIKCIRSDADDEIVVGGYDISTLCYAMPERFISKDMTQSLRHFISFAAALLKDNNARKAFKVKFRYPNMFETLELSQLHNLVMEVYEMLAARA